MDRVASERKISVEEFTLHVTRVEALRTELNKGRTIMNYRILRELTPEQNQKLKEIRRAAVEASATDAAAAELSCIDNSSPFV